MCKMMTSHFTTLGSPGFSLSESWDRNHERLGTGGEAPRLRLASSLPPPVISAPVLPERKTSEPRVNKDSARVNRGVSTAHREPQESSARWSPPVEGYRGLRWTGTWAWCPELGIWSSSQRQNKLCEQERGDFWLFSSDRFPKAKQTLWWFLTFLFWSNKLWTRERGISCSWTCWVFASSRSYLLTLWQTLGIIFARNISDSQCGSSLLDRATT